MRSHLALLVRLVLVTFVVFGIEPSTAGEAAFKVIVHPDNPVHQLDRKFVRDAYLKKALDWSDGATIRPIDLSTPSNVRERFVQDVLNKSPAQLRNYWNQQIFSGKGVPPPTAKSPESVVAFVMANPGAIGFVPATANVGNAKVVAVR